jgi:hypothetical protein
VCTPEQDPEMGTFIAGIEEVFGHRQVFDIGEFESEFFEAQDRARLATWQTHMDTKKERNRQQAFLKTCVMYGLCNDGESLVVEQTQPMGENVLAELQTGLIAAEAAEEDANLLRQHRVKLALHMLGRLEEDEL